MQIVVDFMGHTYKIRPDKGKKGETLNINYQNVIRVDFMDMLYMHMQHLSLSLLSFCFKMCVRCFSVDCLRIIENVSSISFA